MKNFILAIFLCICFFYCESQTCSNIPQSPAGPDKVICQGGSTTIGTSAVSGATYTWYPTTGLSNASISNPIASPSSTTTYTLTVTTAGANLLTNGNFESSGGFLSDYGVYPNTGNPSCGNPYASYALTSNPPSLNAAWCNRTDHSSSGTRMLAADGSCNPSNRVWYTTVPVMQNTPYSFSGWVASLYGSGPNLNIRINGTTISNIQVAPGCSDWNFFNQNWFSSNSNSATIEIRSNSGAFIGNDFAIDDLLFQRCPTVVDQVTITMASAPVVTPGGPITYYNQHESTTNVILTSTPAPSYQWYKNNIAISGATSQTYAIQTTGFGIWTDNYKVVTCGTGTSNIVAFNYRGCNDDSQYPVAPLLPTSPICQVPLQITAPSLGAGASYQWWAANTPTCFSFSPSMNTTNTTQFNVNFPACQSTDGIYTLSSKGQERIYMFYVRPVGCPKPTNNIENKTDARPDYDTLALINKRTNLNISTPKKSVLIPNPAMGRVHLNSPSQITSVEIYNSSGVLVKSIKGNKFHSLSIDVGELKAGFYNCRIFTNTGKEVLKLVVQQ